MRGIRLADVGEMVHGTTLVTNVVIERKGARLGLITTEGFRDILEMGTEQRYDIYDLFIGFPEPFLSRDLLLEVAERVDADGTIVTPLDDEAVEHAAGLSSTTTNAPYANPSQTTNYIVVVSNTSGCTASAEVLITVEDRTGIPGADQTSAVHIYPNPASNGQFTLILNQTLANSDLKATVYSTNGQLLYNRHFPNTNNAAIALQLTDFPSGLYYLELQSENARVVEKLINR